MENLPDIQNTPDSRGKNIERVGVKNVRLPLVVLRKDDDGLPNVVNAKIDMYVNVDAKARGAHMSRCVEVLMEYANKELSSGMLNGILDRMVERLQSADAYLRIRFPYFMTKTAPVSKKQAPQEYYVTFIARRVDGTYDFVIQVEAYVTNLCPCSKQISRYGAHNQRAHLTVKIVPDENLWWIEDIIIFLEAQGSCEIFPLLKRPDEKWVTEKAYENPKFVEDLVRDLAVELDKLKMQQYYIKAEAEESIHIHNAVAYITKDWKLG